MKYLLWSLKLNCAKVKRHQPSVKFIGHLLKSRGLMPNPEKIQPILQMPACIEAIPGVGTYLAKFMLYLSEMTEPLRRLEDKNVEFQWLDQHYIAINTIKKLLTEAPVHRYYDMSSDAESRYAQIEIGLVPITWVCCNFDQYLYG